MTQKRDASQLSRARLRPVGAPGADAVAWGTRGAFALLAAALGVWLWAALRPLPTVDSVARLDALPPPPHARAMSSVDEREARLAVLNADNLFAPDRRFWELKPAPDPAADTPLADAQEAPAADPALVPVAEARSGDPLARFEIADIAKLPSRTAAKVKEVQLFAVYALDEKPRAALRLASEPKEALARSYQVGETLDGDSEWSVAAIDASTDRVVLQHLDRYHMFMLYDEAPMSPTKDPASVAVIAAAPESPPAPRIERQTVAQVRAMLESEGLSELEIAQLLELAQMDEIPPAHAIDAPGDQLVRAFAEQGAETDEAPSEGASPAGLESILRILRSNPLTGERDGDVKAPPTEDDPG